jgi:hypothetical protein
MKRIVAVILVAFVAGAGSWFFGVGVLPAIVIGLTIGAVGVVVRLATLSTGSREWPPPPPVVTDGARRESSDLSWAIRTRGGSVDGRIVERIRRIAAERLAARQLDLDNPAHRSAIQQLIGSKAMAVFSSPTAHSVRIADVIGMLDILDTLERRPPADVRVPATASPNPTISSEKKA